MNILWTFDFENDKEDPMGTRFCLVFGDLAVWEMKDVIKLDYQSQGWNSIHRAPKAVSIVGTIFNTEDKSVV